MGKIELSLITGKKIIRTEARPGLRLSRVMWQAGQPLKLYCGGRGVCGRCFVEIKAGPLPGENEAEKKLRLARGLPSRFRLACQLRLRQPLTVRIPSDLLLRPGLRRQSGDKSGLTMPVLKDYDPLVKKYVLKLSAEDLTADKSPELAIKSALGLKEMDISSSARRKLRAIRKEWSEITAVIYDDRLLLDLECGATADRILGLGLDLGTTTVSARLFDLSTGNPLATATVANEQAAFGADLISRLSFAAEKPGNPKRLQKSALKSIAKLTRTLALEAGVRTEWIYVLCLAGNAVMNHLILAQPVDSLGRAPFRPAFLSCEPVPASKAGLRVNPQAMVFVSPNLGGFVGGDISAGLLYTGLISRRGNFLLVDLGTNGEIVLKSGHTLLAASTAAGPAFEGSGISCGLQAVPGAIEKVKWSQGRFEYRTIGRQKPSGLCGSGLLAVLAEALRAGLLLPSGRIAAGRPEIEVAPGLGLSQLDIRKLQLAMAAVKSGIKLLLRSAGLDWRQLDGLYLAGVFGSSIDPGQCIAVGLIPPLPRKKILFAGNASLAGAGLMLLSRSARKEVEKLRGKVKHISLAENEDFQSEFLRALAIGSQYWRRQDD